MDLAAQHNAARGKLELRTQIHCSRVRAMLVMYIFTKKARQDGLALPALAISSSISGLVVEYIVAIDVTRAQFPADACKMNSLFLVCTCPPQWLVRPNCDRSPALWVVRKQVRTRAAAGKRNCCKVRRAPSVTAPHVLK